MMPFRKHFLAAGLMVLAEIVFLEQEMHML